MYVAMEYAKHGDLRSFLRKSRKLRQHEYGNCGSTPFLSKTMLLRFALDTAQGLRHLADKQVTHSLSLSVCLPACLPVCLSVSLYLYLCLSLSLSICLSLSVSIYLSVSLSLSLSLSLCLSRGA